VEVLLLNKSGFITREVRKPPEYRLRREIPPLGATNDEVQALFTSSSQGAQRLSNSLDSLRYYCTFIGYPRSGHSLVGSLLDAHPNIIIAHELDSLLFLKSGFSDRQLYYLLLENSRIFAQHGRVWGAYSYAVPDQYQGRYTELRVIGDKKGGGTTDRIRQDWHLLERLVRTVTLTHRFVHVIRNPFDNIATIAKRQTRDVARVADWYISLCRTNQRLRSELQEKVMDLHYEDFLQTPTACLARLCEFLGLAPDDDYLNACCAIINPTLHKSRHEVIWTAGARQLVEREIRNCDFLRGYSFDN
jgi:sulfotransferase family protein